MAAKGINHLAVWVGAIVFFFWGFVWWAILFRNQALALSGLTSAQMTPPGVTPHIVTFLMALVLSYGTAIALAKGETQTASHGISFGLFMGIVFYVSLQLIAAVHTSSPIGLWLLESGYALIGFALVGAIVGGWKKRAAA